MRPRDRLEPNHTFKGVALFVHRRGAVLAVQLDVFGIRRDSTLPSLDVAMQADLDAVCVIVRNEFFALLP